jgi:hypothetical protein
MKRILVLAGTILGGIAMLSYRPVRAEAETTTVCHQEDKKDDTGHVILISFEGLHGHSAHGDETWTNLEVGSACVVDGDPNT